jgi:hypothetical protein
MIDVEVLDEEGLGIDGRWEGGGGVILKWFFKNFFFIYLISNQNNTYPIS